MTDGNYVNGDLPTTKYDCSVCKDTKKVQCKVGNCSGCIEATADGSTKFQCDDDKNVPCPDCCDVAKSYECPVCKDTGRMPCDFSHRGKGCKDCADNPANGDCSGECDDNETLPCTRCG